MTKGRRNITIQIGRKKSGLERLVDKMTWNMEGEEKAVVMIVGITGGIMGTLMLASAVRETIKDVAKIIIGKKEEQ